MEAWVTIMIIIITSLKPETLTAPYPTMINMVFLPDQRLPELF